MGCYSNLATQQIAPLAIPLDFYLPKSDEFKANAITFAAYCNSFRETGQAVKGLDHLVDSTNYLFPLPTARS